MADYKETEVSGTQWQRCHKIIINNPLNQIPTVQFVEETIVNVGDTQISQPPVGEQINMQFSGADTIALRNPATGEILGSSVTQQELYVILWSLFMNEAIARDAGGL